MDKAELKRRLRREMGERAAKLDMAYCCEADRAIFRYITELPEYQQAKCIFCFVGTESEVDTVPIIKDVLKKDKILGVPRCVGKGVMDVCRIDSLDSLKPGRYGILEPGKDADLLRPEEIDVAVIPCLSCSPDGLRLGYGGGYYDRYLPQTKAFKTVICRERMMRENIPADLHDVVMDVVVCEMGVRRI